jgi:hypothetical protein
MTKFEDVTPILDVREVEAALRFYEERWVGDDPDDPEAAREGRASDSASGSTAS